MLCVKSFEEDWSGEHCNVSWIVGRPSTEMKDTNEEKLQDETPATNLGKSSCGHQFYIILEGILAKLRKEVSKENETKPKSGCATHFV